MSVIIDNYQQIGTLLSHGKHYQRILDLAHTHTLIGPYDLAAQCLPRVALTRLVRRGQLIRISRGLYALPDRPVSEHGALAETASKYPHVIACLLSALRFHDLTTQSPFEVWLAIPNKARAPRIDYPPLRIIRFSGAALTEGVEVYRIDGEPIRITSMARTVVDCFKYRNKTGLRWLWRPCMSPGEKSGLAWMSSGIMLACVEWPMSCVLIWKACHD